MVAIQLAALHACTFVQVAAVCEGSRLSKAPSALLLQVLLLAGPGVIIGGILTALVAKFIFPYGWSWPQSLLFGSILAATDPVAVVALLREVSCCQLLAHLLRPVQLSNMLLSIRMPPEC